MVASYVPASVAVKHSITPPCFSKVRHTLAAKLNSTRPTLLEVDKVDRIGIKVGRVSDNVDCDKLSNASCCGFIAKAKKTIQAMHSS